MRIGIALFIFLSVFLLNARASRVIAGSTSLNGKTWTLVIVAGSAALIEAAKLSLFDEPKADASAAAADKLLRCEWPTVAEHPITIIQSKSTKDSLDVVPPSTKVDPELNCTPAAAPTSAPKVGTTPSSLAALRLRLLEDVNANTITPSVRDAFENYRTCYNNFILGPDPAGQSAKSNPPPSPTPAPVVHADPAASQNDPLSTFMSNCTVNETFQSQIETIYGIDSRDLTQALKNSIPLTTQISQQNVGSLDDQNLLESQFLLVTGIIIDSAITNKLAVRTAPAAANINPNDLFSKCIDATSRAALGCVQTLDAGEKSLAGDHLKAVACSFASRNWLPTFTATKRAGARLAKIRPKGSNLFSDKTLLATAPGC